MAYLKKIFIIITLLSIVAAHFSLSSWAASSDTQVDIDFNHKAITFIDFENFCRKREDTALLMIKRYNPTLFNTIKDRVINHGDYFYINISKSTLDYAAAYVFRVYFYEFDTFTSNRVLTYGDQLTTNQLYYTYFEPTVGNGEYVNEEVGTYQVVYAYPSYNIRYNYTIVLNDHSKDATTQTNISNSFAMVAACYGYISDYAMKLFDNSTTDYNSKLNTINSNLSSLVTNSATIISKLDTIKGAIDNGTNTISSTIVSTHNSDNNNNNKNTNEIIDAIQENTNSLSDVQITNDNSDLINAINSGFAGLNSNNNNNTNEIVSTINNASEDIQNDINSSTNAINNNNNNNTNSIINGNNNNTNTIISNDDTNTNTITEAIEGISISGGSDNTDTNTIIGSINNNNNYNTNRILDSTVTEESSDIMDNVDTPQLENPVPDVGEMLDGWFTDITDSSITSKTFSFRIFGNDISFTLDYNVLYDKLFKNNNTFYVFWQSLWWVIFGVIIYMKVIRAFNQITAGEWDELFTKSTISDDIIDESVK